MAQAYLCIQLHDMGHLVPAEAHEALVVLWTVSSHHNVRFKVRLPLHFIRCGGCSPFGIVGRSVTFGPHMIPGEAGREGRGEDKMMITYVSVLFRRISLGKNK